MNVLYVTSFSADIYRATGARLVESFLCNRVEGSLLACFEQEIGDCLPVDQRVLKYDLDRSDFLRSWLAANHDIIPTALGGAVGKCDCPEPELPLSAHRRGCVWGWWNKNASRWFRKIVSLEYAQSVPGYDALVWLDSDCRFRRRLPAAEVNAWFGDAAVFIHKSKDRPVVESGVIGFRMNDAGRRFLNVTAERYRSGAFRRYDRWDDGFQFQITLNIHRDIPVIDLATHATWKTFVIQNSPAGQYIEHEKGIHGRSGVLF